MQSRIVRPVFDFVRGLIGGEAAVAASTPARKRQLDLDDSRSEHRVAKRQRTRASEQTPIPISDHSRESQAKVRRWLSTSATPHTIAPRSSVEEDRKPSVAELRRVDDDKRRVAALYDAELEKRRVAALEAEVDRLKHELERSRFEQKRTHFEKVASPARVVPLAPPAPPVRLSSLAPPMTRIRTSSVDGRSDTSSVRPIGPRQPSVSTVPSADMAAFMHELRTKKLRTAPRPTQPQPAPRTAVIDKSRLRKRSADDAGLPPGRQRLPSPFLAAWPTEHPPTTSQPTVVESPSKAVTPARLAHKSTPSGQSDREVPLPPAVKRTTPRQAKRHRETIATSALDRTNSDTSSGKENTARRPRAHLPDLTIQRATSQSPSPDRLDQEMYTSVGTRQIDPSSVIGFGLSPSLRSR